MKQRKEQIDEAVKALKAGGTLLYPTDTIWGIGCDATNEDAVEKVFGLKQRSDSKSLIILASDMDMVARYVREIPEMAVTVESLSDKPLTIIYPEGINLAPNVTAEDGSIAIRIPKCDFCIELIRRFGRPIVSTSANISGTPAPRRYADISDDVKKSVDCAVDPAFEHNSTGKASSIIKLGIYNEVQVIRE
ncbi:MAG TPA: threonylcarbamoyl-AMP synthase [Candidatus Coprenecus stercoravium]|uniref:L-threonylcarbamoyladenylate synthase n=1 Tax=Candidatus Coprenecus stercoravium TaxID=2840735 RepID=A0A9D2GSB1_9BACT|nr:threonylcarbamoyl-AMP synthase [Candidatus Coprenecus stercoravium]